MSSERRVRRSDRPVEAARLYLAEQFPARHAPVLLAPVFGR